MANKYKGEVAFEAGGQPLVIRFSANAIVGVEDAFDKTIQDVGAMLSDSKTLRMSTIKRIFCIGLIDHYAESETPYNDASAAAIFARLSPSEATTILTQAFTAAFDSGEKAECDKNPPTPGDLTAGSGPAS